MSVQVNWDHVNLALINEVICSGFWYFDCDENSKIVNANWSHEFRKMLGFHDTLDFPNKLESWSNLLHPQDKERVMVQLQAAIKDTGFYYVFCKLEEIDTVPKFTPDSEKRRRDLEEYEKAVPGKIDNKIADISIILEIVCHPIPHLTLL